MERKLLVCVCGRAMQRAMRLRKRTALRVMRRQRINHDYMNGKLSDQPLAELIREIGSKLFSGALRLERELAKTVIYFEKGRLVFAASNIRTLRLREYMKKEGVDFRRAICRTQ